MGGSNHRPIQALSWKLPGGTKENHGKPQDIGPSN